MSAQGFVAISALETTFRLRGAFAFGGALILARLIQAASFFVMAHLLTETQMGVLAILTVLFLGFFQLTNLGFDRYVIYSKDRDPASLKRTINAVWTLQLLRAAFVLAAIVPVTAAVNMFPGFDLRLTEVLGIGVAVTILSLVSPALSTFERRGDFNAIARARALSVATAGVTTILVVFVWPEPWAYVVGQIAGALAFTGVSFLYTVERPRISLDRSRIRDVFGYSKHLLIIAGVSFLSAQLQTLYVGAMFGAATLGLFFTWLRTVSLPQEILTQFLGRILFAKATDQARGEGQFARSHLLGFAIMMGVVMPFHLFVWFHGDLMIAVLAGEKWVSYWWAGQVIALIGIANALIATIGPFMLTVCPQVSSTLRAAETTAGAGLMFLLGPIYGVAGVLASMLAVSAAGVLIRGVLIYRRLIVVDQSAHARACIGVLLSVTLPFLMAELLLAPFAERAVGSLGVVGTYLGLFLALVLVGIKYRATFLRRLTPDESSLRRA